MNSMTSKQSNMKNLINIVCISIVLAISHPALSSPSEINVILINPDKQGRPFWDLTTSIAQAAASNLGINLTVKYGGGNRFNNYKFIQTLVKESTDIDYIVFLPHKGKSAQSFDVLEKAKIPFFSLERSMNKHEMKQVKLPGDKYKYWLGEIYYDDIQGGELLSQALLTAHANKSKNVPAIFGLNGDYSQLSTNRELGLQRTLKKSKYLNQTVKTIWDPEVAKNKLKGALIRYPNTNIIWAASDELALAASQVIKGYTDKNITLGGIGWLPSAIKAVDNKVLDATVGGHFMQAAWAIVQVFDHSKGLHAVEHNRPLENRPLKYNLIDQNNSKQFLWLTDSNNFKLIDFKKHSLFYNTELTKYNFSFPPNPNDIKHNN
ncbi:MAG: ABC transporter substrate-binding protein [Colwellia sp.]